MRIECSSRLTLSDSDLLEEVHRLVMGERAAAVQLIAAIFDRAMTVLLAELYKTRHALVDRPHTGRARLPRGRRIPAAAKRKVWTRDGGQCAFVGIRGRCTERGFLEYHHIVPFADNGAASADNLELRCRAHNRHEAERWFRAREEQLPDAA